MSEYTIWYIGGFSGFVERRKMKLYLEKKMIENKEITIKCGKPKPLGVGWIAL